MMPAKEISLRANRIAGVEPGIGLGFLNAGALEDPISIESSRLLEDIKRSLNSDLRAAKRSALRLAAFLNSKLTHEAPAVKVRCGLAPWQKRKVLIGVENRLAGPLCVGDLAKLAALSPSYFSRAFKESIGEPPHIYVTKKRVERAQHLMMTTKEELSQIALMCGLVDQSHLCRCFRKVTGITPAVWRRRNMAGGKLASTEISAGEALARAA